MTTPSLLALLGARAAIGAAANPPQTLSRLADVLADNWNNPAPGGMVSMAQDVGRGLMAPGRALSGEYSYLTDEDLSRGTTPQQRMTSDAQSLAGVLMGGGFPMAQRGALGMAGGRMPTGHILDDPFIKKMMARPQTSESRARLGADDLRRSLGVDLRSTGNPEVDAIIKRIDDVLKIRGP